MPLSLRLAPSPTALAPTTGGFSPAKKQCRIPYSGVATTTTRIGFCSLDYVKRGDSSVVRCSLETVNVSVGQVTEVDKDTFWPIVKAAGEKIVVLDMYTQWYESVKKRLESEQGMSYTEFSYQLLQGYDFVHLFDKERVNVQIGGSDQWGNITAGTDLIRKILQAEEAAYGLTFPLLLKNDGTKFGKSEDGAIWLSPSMLSPYKFYQYFFSVPDVDVIRFLKTLTFLSLDEIKMVEDDMRKPGYVPNSAQMKLAEEVTRFVHGEEGLKEAIKATEALRPGAETKLDWNLIERIAEDIPTCSLPIDRVSGVSIVDVSISVGLFESKSAAKRTLKQGGVYMNNERVDDENKRVEEDDIVDGKGLVLSSGKKNKVGFPEILKGTRIRPYITRYLPPFEEFEVDVCDLPPGASTVFPSVPGPSLLIVLQGEGRMSTDASADEVSMGDVLFVPADTEIQLKSSSDLKLYRAGVNNRFLYSQ
ncbi:hypothetical protein F2Q69_00039291 [Brassica cretica]|uniref:Tyrosine--tRNA ligase n=1 Tax=Brassica cretica TaxID=69181 RepID=A0A8S9SHC7_BRACR|nr:hypothetical protein F2Q69_00039291 [Brassica cretica]